MFHFFTSVLHSAPLCYNYLRTRVDLRECELHVTQVPLQGNRQWLWKLCSSKTHQNSVTGLHFVIFRLILMYSRVWLTYIGHMENSFVWSKRLPPSVWTINLKPVLHKICVFLNWKVVKCRQQKDIIKYINPTSCRFQFWNTVHFTTEESLVYLIWKSSPGCKLIYLQMVLILIFAYQYLEVQITKPPYITSSNFVTTEK